MANVVLYYATIRGLGEAHEEHVKEVAVAEKPKAEPKKEEPKKEEPKKEEPKKEAAADDDDVDLFGDVDEEEVEREKKRRQAEIEAKKKAEKPAIIQKSNLILDVKPFDDQTDMAEVEAKVREITMDGLVWGPSKLVEIAYGIKKLQICAVIEDEKVMTEDVEEKIMDNEDLVQSVDVASFTKV